MSPLAIVWNSGSGRAAEITELRRTLAGRLTEWIDLSEISELETELRVVRVRGKRLERYYANIAAGGNWVRVSETITDELKSRWGAFRYIRGAIDVLPNMTSYRISATCDSGVFTQLDSWAVLVANGKPNAGRIEVAPKASPTDGLIDVVIVRNGTVGDMVEIVANNLLGDFLESDQVIFRQVRSLHPHSNPPMPFTMDGEVVDEAPVHFDVVPGAIHMHIGKH
ncbi:Diacylglycerol kinase [Novipirellula aureliae]|uniref:Diacylglycerol kinase n=1 Tax=Novipirellula aureliae TaxID=2527966 RepID=A0A5C6DPZ4_9BACT|nr:hypothetical protein [Novipirellula aureliae]TWU38818.1 Diacylglycerol kinase [Novipirellula aureliae]